MINKTQRLFIAVPLPEEIKSKIINIKLPENFRKTTKENLHITLLFFGETPLEKTDKIIECMKDSLKNLNSFDLELSSTGQFPRNAYPQIIYITGEKGKEKINFLANRLRNNFKNIYLPDNKPFKYHITLGRQKYSVNEFVKLPELVNNVIFTVNKVILYKSVLKPEGPTYTPLAEIELNKENKH